MIFERSIDQCAQKSKRQFKDRDPRETAIRMQNAKTVADDDYSKQWSAMLSQTIWSATAELSGGPLEPY